MPPSTLKDRLSGRVKHGSKPDPAPYLSSDEESELVEFLKTSAKIGFGKTKKEIFSIVQLSLKKKCVSVENFNGESWWNRFTQRHPNLTLRSSDPLSRVRVNAVTKDNVNRYFA